jgi:uncharacterized protein involved in exopolysaccharide biosynthesis
MDKLTFRSYMKFLSRQKLVIILCIIAINLIVIVGLKFQTPRYAAKVKILINSQKESGSPLALTQSEIVTSIPVLDRALKAILPYKPPISDYLEYEKGFASPLKQVWIAYQVKKFNQKLDNGGIIGADRQTYLYQIALEDLRKNIKVVPIKNTNIFTITVSDYDRIGSAVMANIVSRSYLIFDLEQQLAEMQQKYGKNDPAISQLRDEIQTMTKNLTGQPLDNVEDIGPASVKIIEQAYPPLEPEGPKKATILILGFIMSIFLGLMLASFLDTALP